MSRVPSLPDYGYRVGYYLVEPLSSELSEYRCCACSQMLQDPRKTSCGHRFRCHCWEVALSSLHVHCNLGNPVDKTAIDPRKTLFDREWARDMGDLRVWCKYWECSEKIQLRCLEDHENECKDVIIECPYKDCLRFLTREEFYNDHQHSCVWLKQYCGTYPHRDYQDHVRVCEDCRISDEREKTNNCGIPGDGGGSASHLGSPSTLAVVRERERMRATVSRPPLMSLPTLQRHHDMSESQSGEPDLAVSQTAEGAISNRAGQASTQTFLLSSSPSADSGQGQSLASSRDVEVNEQQEEGIPKVEVQRRVLYNMSTNSYYRMDGNGSRIDVEPPP